MNESFYLDKKREYETKARQARELQDYSKALFFVAKAAEFSFNLAELSEAALKQAYISQAYELLQQAKDYQREALEFERKRKQVLLDTESEQQPTSAWRLNHKPDVTLDQVAGLHAVKERLQQDVLLPLQHRELYDRFKLRKGGGILMYGPQGTGKTLLASSIAGSLDAAFFSVDASLIRSKFVGETEKNMRRLFVEARSAKRAVIFFDECDSLLKKGTGHDLVAVKQFLVMTDGLNDLPKENLLLILAATNKPWNLEPSILRYGRIGVQILVDLPDAPARLAILEGELRDVPMRDDYDPEALVSATVGFSGADLVAVTDLARKAVVHRAIESDATDEPLLGQQDLLASIAEFTPSVSTEEAQRFYAWEASRKKKFSLSLQ